MSFIQSRKMRIAAMKRHIFQQVYSSYLMCSEGMCVGGGANLLPDI
jgi:hypothetical protein